MGVFGACFGGAFKCNRRVESFEKRHAFMQHVPEEIYRHARTLQELHLDSNNIRELPKQFFKLTNLKVLNMCDNDLTLLPNDITLIAQLVQLDLSRNDIPQIPDNIKMLGSLELVDFSANPLTQIPSSLCYLRSLKQLRINAISLERFPDCIGELKSLVQLEARENMITQLPDGLCNLESLEQLDLGENEIDALPANFGALTKLRELWLDTNEIKALPQSIGALRDLSIADFANNKIETVPDSIEGCTGMTDLTLRQNYLSQLPASIGKLRNLQVLKVDENKLTDLCHTIGDCQQLTELVLTENLLSILPESLGQLTKLNVLNVDRNRLYILTNRIGQCAALRVLSLRENLLKEIPPSIGDCANLHVINVSGNQLDYLPHTLLQLDVKAIWLSENQAQPLMKFQQETLVGAGGPKKVLTCFLLPQRAAGDPSRAPLFPQQQPEQEDYVPERPAVQFNEEEVDTQDQSQQEGNFERNVPGKTATPHPGTLKEMKEKQAEYARKQQERLSQEHLDKEVEQDEEEEELKPLINDESHEEQQSLDSPKVKFEHETENQATEQFPLESRLKRKNTPHFKRDLAIDPTVNIATGLMDAIPQLDLGAMPLTMSIALAGEGSFGLSIAGGGGSPPYIEGDGSVFISRVVPDGRASKAGIEVGDKLVEINGANVLETEHETVANQLRELRSTNKTPLFVLHRFPLVQGYQRMDEESDVDEHQAQINQQLNFSMVSASEVDESVFEPEQIETETAMVNGGVVEEEHVESQPLMVDSGKLDNDIDELEDMLPEMVPPPPVAPPVQTSVTPPPPLTPPPQTAMESGVGCVPLTPPPLPVQIEAEIRTSESICSTPANDLTNTESLDYASLPVSQQPPSQPQIEQNHENVKSHQINRDFQSPRPFSKVDTSPTDGAALSFKDKMKLFRESGTVTKVTNQTKKVSLVSAQDVKSIKADESRKVDFESTRAQHTA